MKKVLTLILETVLSVVVFTLLCCAAEDYYVFDAAELSDIISPCSQYSVLDPIVDNDTLYARIRTTTNATASDGTQFDIKLADIASDMQIVEYPIIKIGYRSNVADADACIDMNVGLNYAGTSTRLWGLTFAYVKDDSDQTILFDLSQKATSGENISNYAWSNVDASSPVNYLRFKTYYREKALVENEHFDIEYIAFFKDMATAENFDFDFVLNDNYTDVYLKEQVRRIVKGNSINVNIAYKPSFNNVPVGVTFSSDAPNVATVDSTGKVTAVAAGSANITATFGDFTSTCKVIVLDEAIKPVKIVAKDVETTTDNVIVSCLGDSITTYAPSPNGGMNYHDWWAEWYHLTNEDKGISGTTVGTANGSETAFVLRYDTMRDDADLVTVKGGTNDFGVTSQGKSGDRVTTTYRGALRILMEGLIQKYPDRPIVFFTPIRRCEGGQTVDTMNRFGDKLSDFAEAVKEIGADYDIPVVDLYNVAELDFTSKVISSAGFDDNNVWHDAVCEDDRMPDGLHPSGKGHVTLAEYMMKSMKRLGIVDVDIEDDVLCGDADGNGSINANDSIVLSRYIAEQNGYANLISLTNCDLNSDTKVDSSDAVILSRHIANWSGYLTLPLVQTQA